jgi:hypothetical protein
MPPCLHISIFTAVQSFLRRPSHPIARSRLPLARSRQGPSVTPVPFQPRFFFFSLTPGTVPAAATKHVGLVSQQHCTSLALRFLVNQVPTCKLNPRGLSCKRVPRSSREVLSLMNSRRYLYMQGEGVLCADISTSPLPNCQGTTATAKTKSYIMNHINDVLHGQRFPLPYALERQ